jgi:opacity protein-like surface antigen
VRTGALLAAALASAAFAAQATVYAVTTDTIETAVTADFNGDGTDDNAWVIRRNEAIRELHVVTSYRTATDFGENPAQVLSLDPDPLGDATLEVKGKVLLLNDLTGGTTAVASTHRFRWDAKLEAMRLIGLDATLYSRTFAHDGRTASWNLLTGVLLTRTMRLRQDGSNAAYDEVNRQRKKKTSPPLRLEQSPGGDDLLGWPGAQ